LSIYHQDAGGNRSAKAIVPLVEHLVSWLDAKEKGHFVRKTLFCSGVTAAMPMDQWLAVRLSPC